MPHIMKHDKPASAGKPAHGNGLPAGLYPVAIPIGNPDDITIRALETLRQCNAVICEERKEGRRLLKAFGIEKPMYFLNEHSVISEIRELFEALLIMKDKAIALVGDAGTPCFADPGAELVNLCHEFEVSVYPVPGASSLMAALSASGLKSDRFLYYGFLSAKKEERKRELASIKAMSRYDVIFLEAPYRLKSVLEDIIAVLGKKRRIRVFYKLTQPAQQIIIGTLEDIAAQTVHLQKGEFILILEHEPRNWL